MTTIFDFARQGDTGAIVNVLNSHPEKLEEVDVEENNTVLAAAVSFGHKDTVIMLLDRGANIDTLGDDDWTLLHKACYQGHADVALLLIERGLNPSVKDTNGWTPLHNACADGHLDMTTLLLDKGSDKDAPDNDGWTPLHLACDCADDEDHCQVVRLLVEKGANLESRDNNGETCLHRACTKGSQKLASVLIEMGADITAADNFGWSVLHIAAAKGHGALIGLLIDKGTDPDYEDLKGWTPLLVSAACGQTKSITALVDKRADVNHCATDFTTPLYLACAKGYDDAVLRLIEAGADLEAKVGGDELTALMIATGKGKKSTAALLIKKGADIEARDLNSLTVLQRVAAKGLPEMVKLLIDSNVDITAKAQFGSTALDFAIDKKHEEVIALLKKATPIVLKPPAPLRKSPAAGSTAGGHGPPGSELGKKGDYGGKLIAEKAAEMGHRRRNRQGVRASMNMPAGSDAEAAARVALSLTLEDDETMPGLSSSLSQMAKDIASENANRSDVSSSVKKAQMEALPPTLFSEVLRVAPQVKAQSAADTAAGAGAEGKKLNVKDLRRRSIAAVIAFDVTRKEEYLTDDQFFELFKMSKEVFNQQPKWKKEMTKKELGLF